MAFFLARASHFPSHVSTDGGKGRAARAAKAANLQVVVVSARSDLARRYFSGILAAAVLSALASCGDPNLDALTVSSQTKDTGGVTGMGGTTGGLSTSGGVEATGGTDGGGPAGTGAVTITGGRADWSGGSTGLSMDCPSQDQWPPQGESCAGVLGPCPFFVAKGTVMVLCHCVEEVFLCYYAADNCPWEPPYDGSFCPEPDLRCQYSSQTCQCTDYSWTCGRSSDSSNDSNQDSTCPNSRPTSGDTCGLSASIPCLYSDSLCTCGNGTWDCGPYCPTEEPGPDEMCGIPSELACYYDVDQCVCGSDETWDCEPYCPAEEPAGDDECNIPFEFLCYYDKNECVCGSDGTWDCESYCPSEEPAGKYCDLPGYLMCPYEASQCACSGDGTWSCVSGFCPDAQPDAGMECPTGAPVDLTCTYDAGATQCSCDADGLWGCVDSAAQP